MTSEQPHPSSETASRLLPRALVYYAAYVILGLSLSVVGPTLPELAAQTGSTLGQISVVFAASSLGVVAGSLLGGYAPLRLDKTGRNLYP